MPPAPGLVLFEEKGEALQLSVLVPFLDVDLHLTRGRDAEQVTAASDQLLVLRGRVHAWIDLAAVPEEDEEAEQREANRVDRDHDPGVYIGVLVAVACAEPSGARPDLVLAETCAPYLRNDCRGSTRTNNLRGRALRQSIDMSAISTLIFDGSSPSAWNLMQLK